VRPIYQTKKVRGAAALTVKAISGLLPDLYQDKSALDVTHRGAVTHIVENAPYVPIAQRAAVVEGEFSEVPALPPPVERADIAALRAQAAKLMADPDRPSAHPTAPVDTGVPKGGSNEPPERQTGAPTEPRTPKPYDREPPTQVRGPDRSKGMRVC
jgi:hypothetical protein